MTPHADWPADQAPGPPVQLELPDGQSITAQLLARVREPREWWAEVGVTAWARTELEGRVVAEPVTMSLEVPYRLLTPLEGTDYSGVPVRRAGAPSAPPQNGLWVLQKMRRGEHVAYPQDVVHETGCWVAHGGNPVTLEQARQLLTAGAVSCTVCRAAEVLGKPQT